ncbi:glycosyltransferase [Actinophytocola sp.]|uniref:glycosyltransferase n=1 Tax=Actinophytocola sp. TaxID=1872138 RepID=UPI002ED1A1C8
MVTPAWERRPGSGRRLVHVSAAAHGSGVAELLAGLVPAQAATGMSVGWAVLGGDPEFFAFTRYLHQLLHGRANAMTAERLGTFATRYRAVLAPQADWLAEQLAPGDVVVLHDPATLGMASRLAEAGLVVVWHCHAGTTDEQASGPLTVWHAFAAELSDVDKVVTTLPEFAPHIVPPADRRVFAPAVDPHSARNRPLSRGEMAELLAHPGRVEQDGPLPDGAPVVLQVARWDPLKDMPGVLRCVPELPPEVHVVLAGADPETTPDDPDGRAVLDVVRGIRAGLSPADRARVHLVLPDGQDRERAPLVVNALQRRADVVLQKSLAEGFGLTLTEAMLKGRAVVAADVGGLRQQISPGHNGLLVRPRDHESVVLAVRTLLDDPLLRRRLGRHAAESASRRYLMPRLVADYQRYVVSDPPARVA